MKLSEFKKPGNIIGIAVFMLIGFYMVYQHLRTQKLFDDPSIEKRVTIAEIIGFRGGAKGPPSFEYEFSVGDDTFGNPHPINSELRLKTSSELKKNIGKRYFVLFVVKDPTYSRLLINQPVLDSTLQPKDTGWTLEEFEEMK